uniref:hypothetical protein n=1 Tax=Amycolatopsis sp. CA-096443 TaxID=3239919 RepID=UPI003F49A23D
MAETLRCLDRDGTCRGAVEYRASLSGTGKPIARCEDHYRQRLEARERAMNRGYSDSPVAPADVDPGYAGEAWDEDC